MSTIVRVASRWERAATAVVLGLATLLVPLECLADNADDARGDGSGERDRPSFLLEAALGPAWFKGDPGLWVEALAARAFPIGDSTDLVGAIGPIFTLVSETDEQDFDGDFVEDIDTEDSFSFGLVLRGYVDHRFSGWFAGRLGVALGVAHLQMESTYCGDVAATAMLYGVWGGPVVLLSRRVELGLTADIVQSPRNACSAVTDLETGMKRRVAFRQKFLDPSDFDGTATLLARIGYRF
jgi:hypothetical protein